MEQGPLRPTGIRSRRKPGGEAERLYQLGVKQLADGTYSEAVRNLTACSERRPEYPDYWHALGRARLAADEPQEAARAFEQAIELNPGYVQALFDLAVAYALVGRFEDATLMHERATQGFVYGQGEDDSAADREQRRTSARRRFAEGLNHLRDDDREKALEAFILASNPKPAEVDILVEAALEDCENQRFAEAAEKLRTVIEQDPYHIDAYVLQADLAMEEENVDEAVTLLRHALSIAPTYPDLHLRLGETLLSSGYVQEAIEHLETAVDINAEYLNAYVFLARAYAETGRLDDALEAAETARALADDALALYTCAWVAEKQERFDVARQIYESIRDDETYGFLVEQRLQALEA